MVVVGGGCSPITSWVWVDQEAERLMVVYGSTPNGGAIPTYTHTHTHRAGIGSGIKPSPRNFMESTI